ncbi:hypothetical protein NI389_17595 (plasmid) [Pseudoalteromonas xiamenensis]|uniref:hypothetical protein n=1 Tax=Pseudoalteromonas xiamenensis TaxID=882626 RepID=UPI0027E3D901|nr:hypothetical protein [Pseudoalteromonas xiamenensis]WMN61629.1 hypothetical protein NI389_17595 [Pseudoalteromonas xiamenensis]
MSIDPVKHVVTITSTYRTLASHEPSLNAHTNEADVEAVQSATVHLRPNSNKEKGESPLSVLDEEANSYKKQNRSFKRAYEKLEQTLIAVREQLNRQLEELTKLKQSKSSRALKVHIASEPDKPEIAAHKNGHSVNAYLQNEPQDEIEALESQIAANKSLEGELLMAMAEMVFEERARIKEEAERKARLSRLR